jgi:uroporphyrinogen decarboxylase
MECMTTRERFERMYEHRDADRVPIIDSPWPATVARWQSEGMPADVSFVDFFGLDHVVGISADNSPQYPEELVEETDEFRVTRTRWGATLKQFTHTASTPEFLDFRVQGPDSWAEAKARIRPERDRVNWEYLRRNYRSWREKGYWIQAGLWFGFDVTHSWMIGTERTLMAMVEEPEWLMDIFGHQLDTHLTLLDMIWDEGYEFDAVRWPDDMGYKHNQFFSRSMYRELLLPFQARAVEWAHAHGIKAELHSCGDINPFVPDLIAAGLDALNPLEVKAGMDPLGLKREYGERLVLHGGVNAMLWDNPEAIRAEMEAVVPVLKQNGGYIFSSDHSVPSSVSLEDFRGIVGLAKRLGAYG